MSRNALTGMRVIPMECTQRVGQLARLRRNALTGMRVIPIVGDCER